MGDGSGAVRAALRDMLEGISAARWKSVLCGALHVRPRTAGCTHLILNCRLIGNVGKLKIRRFAPDKRGYILQLETLVFARR